MKPFAVLQLLYWISYATEEVNPGIQKYYHFDVTVKVEYNNDERH